jgi:DtxR family Mn-dependent transcriptional regulator
MSVAIENFIKAIYLSNKHYGKDTKPGNIARKLGVSNAAATDMAKKLAEKNLLHYEKYQELRLTEEGDKMALNVIRKHRLWEALLFKLFDMNMHEIHHEAELLEHQTSDLLAEKIYEYLGKPEFDPHGEPIPNANGQFSTKDISIVLAEAKENKSYIISKLVSSDKEFFDFCADNGLRSGTEILVVKQFSNSKMTQIQVGENTLVLHQDFTQIIYINEAS